MVQSLRPQALERSVSLTQYVFGSGVLKSPTFGKFSKPVMAAVVPLATGVPAQVALSYRAIAQPPAGTLPPPLTLSLVTAMSGLNSPMGCTDELLFGLASARPAVTVA